MGKTLLWQSLQDSTTDEKNRVSLCNIYLLLAEIKTIELGQKDVPQMGPTFKKTGTPVL